MNTRTPSPLLRCWPAAVAWAAGWAALLLLDGRVDIGNQALVLVATAAVATLWLPGWGSALSALVAVAAFNWSFVPPRYSFAVDVEQHALLLATQLVVVWIVAALVTRHRRMAGVAEREARREARLRTWADALRGEPDPHALAGALQTGLAEASGSPVSLALATATAPMTATAPRTSTASHGRDQTATTELQERGTVDARQRRGLAACIRYGEALGPGTGRHEDEPDVYLPLRAGGQALGAAVIQGFDGRAAEHRLLEHLQALCDQMGEALLRSTADREAGRLRDAARDQALRNTLLTAIAHDHRTPLATILGAATSLLEQQERLGVQQRRQLARAIVEEAERLARLTDNTLQLARLDAPGVQPRCDWESAEELVGAAIDRTRRRGHGRTVRDDDPDSKGRLEARVEPGLPLLWCDPTLLSQLLDNLVDNALKYAGDESPVEIRASRSGDHIVIGVLDRGPGVAGPQRDGIFEAFNRGDPETVAGHPGAGIGLAVCAAIARIHGGTLRYRPRGRGGSAFECILPVHAQPKTPA